MIQLLAHDASERQRLTPAHGGAEHGGNAQSYGAFRPGAHTGSSPSARIDVSRPWSLSTFRRFERHALTFVELCDRQPAAEIGSMEKVIDAVVAANESERPIPG